MFPAVQEMRRKKSPALQEKGKPEQFSCQVMSRALVWGQSWQLQWCLLCTGTSVHSFCQGNICASLSENDWFGTVLQTSLASVLQE